MAAIKTPYVNRLKFAEYFRMGHDLIGDIEYACSPHLTFEQLQNEDWTIFVLNFRPADAPEHFHLVCQPDASCLYFTIYDGPGETFGERRPVAMWSVFQSSLDGNGRLQVVANDPTSQTNTMLSINFPSLIEGLGIEHDEGLTDIVDDITRRVRDLLADRV